jgi:aminoglycoside phosphotransferase family enzyme/predicted kinase
VTANDQAAVIELLASPATHGGAPVERIDTHGSVVFLAGDRAWKLKRAVHFDYMDFSTPDRRRACCDAEVRINRRAAPALYRGVVAITREPNGRLALGGSGIAIEWVVEMNRFDQEQLLDRLAERNALECDLMPPLARAIVRFHAGAPRRPDHGGAAGMTWVVDGNAAGFAELGAALDPEACARITRDARREIDRHQALLELRRAGGLVRQCHGDLHLRNVVLLDGRPTLFDAVEFNDDIACIDVFYDLAFLLMDLWHRQLPAHANAVWNTYLSDAGDHSALALLPLFLSCRAAVRAKTSATAARFQSAPAPRAALERDARAYLAMAEQLLHPAAPSVIAIGGFSGSGKSTLARGLAPSIGAVPGALVVRSDEIRKRMCGVAPLERLGADGYTPEMSARVYGAAVAQAAAAVAAGHAVIVDAVFANPADRDAVERAAAAASVPFHGLWLEAPEQTLIERSQQRRRDVSDADGAVIRSQLARDPGTIRWQVVDASPPAEVVLRRVSAIRGTRA